MRVIINEDYRIASENVTIIVQTAPVVCVSIAVSLLCVRGALS